MKKNLSMIALLLTITLSLTSCGLSEKVYEMQQEEIIENLVGDEANIDIDGDTFVLKDEEGNVMTIGGVEWPTGAAADLLPKLNKGTIIAGLTSDQVCSINVEELDKKDFEDYLEEIKEKGFINNVTEMYSEGSYTYIANKEDNEWIQIYYDENEKTIDLIVGIDEE
ncbi:MAG TPA: DUF6591 domain-containing protein [Lachnospiraceae bacterium]|nr:DUF6591 domain-containing protein [Lachnospiraceae bacterium]